MTALKTIALDWLPPAFVRWLRQKRGGGIRFEGDYQNWADAASRCTGYDAEGILAKVLDATLKVKRGEAAFERDSVLFNEVEYAWPVLAGLMWAAARNGGRLNVLDFGGALGSSYFQNRKFLQTLPDVRWNVVEQAHYVKAGEVNLQEEQLRFYKTIENCLISNQPNVVLLSSVLQYLPEPAQWIQKIKMLGADVIIVDRTIINFTEVDRLYIQHVPATIYPANYPCHTLSERRLINALDEDYVLEASFPSLPFPALLSIASEFKGYIFTKTSHEINCS